MKKGQPIDDSARSQREQAVAERRKHRRFLEEVRVRYRDIEGNDPARWAQSRDLSLGGIGVSPEEGLLLGAHLALEIHIENETAPVLALGRVVRCEEDGSGVQFLWISDEDRANLDRLSTYFREKYGNDGDLDSSGPDSGSRSDPSSD